ncbi:hypothetical protein C8Q74DRAFT_1435199 [Fomes fomentarius]|nr:hypothetical protein C8Q74DRAFT_1435199 [Fomes fomentarius]
MLHEAMRDFETLTRRPDDTKLHYLYTMEYVARAALLDFRMILPAGRADQDQDQEMDANAYASILQMVVIIIELKAASTLEQGAARRAAEAQIIEWVQILDDEENTAKVVYLISAFGAACKIYTATYSRTSYVLDPEPNPEDDHIPDRSEWNVQILTRERAEKLRAMLWSILTTNGPAPKRD